MFVTFFDTCMVSLTALIVWRLSPWIVFFPWLTIACLDGLYISSALTKVPDGAWFTLTLAGVLACIFILWRFGKEQQWLAEAEDRFPTTHLVKKRADGSIELTDLYGGYPLSIIKGFGIFFDKAGETTPAVFTYFLSKLIAAPEVMVFFHLRPLETPSVPPENRYYVSRLAIPNCYRLIVRHGYMDAVITPNLASLVFEQIRDFIIRQDIAKQSSRAPQSGPLPNRDIKFADEALPAGESDDNAITRSPTSSSDIEKTSGSPAATVSADLFILQPAYDHQILYIIGKEQMRVKAESPFWRKLLLKAFLFLRDNTRTKIANLKVPTDRVIEVGFVKDV
jgi:KUP system potassium uptake protein